jgi:hypothetical protein
MRLSAERFVVQERVSIIARVVSTAAVNTRHSTLKFEMGWGALRERGDGGE